MLCLPKQLGLQDTFYIWNLGGELLHDGTWTGCVSTWYHHWIT
jgi:hypothetical protein